MFSESSIDVWNVLLEGLDSAHWKRKSQKFSFSGYKQRHRHTKISVNVFKKKTKNSEWEILKSENLEIS